jgi:hypothetical protein
LLNEKQGSFIYRSGVGYVVHVKSISDGLESFIQILSVEVAVELDDFLRSVGRCEVSEQDD